MKYEALEISDVGGRTLQLLWDLLKESYYTLQLLLGSLLKQNSPLIGYTTVAAGLFCKQSTLHITVAIGGHFESVVSPLTHYICYCGPP